MQRFRRVCAAFCSGVLVIGFLVQAVLGVCWMCYALAQVKSFGGGLVCVGQILAFAAAVYFFAGKRRGSVLIVCAVLTFPMVMQSLVQSDVRTLATALFLVQTGCVLRSVGDREEGKYFSKSFPQYFYMGLGAWVGAALLLRAYLYLGAVPAVAGALYLWAAERRRGACPEDTAAAVSAAEAAAVAAKAARRRVCLRLLAVAAAGGMAFGVGSFYQERTHFTTHLVSRVAWTSLYHSYWELEKRDRWKIDHDEMLYSSYEAAGIKNNFLPFLSERAGEQETERLFTELSKAAWKYGKKKVVKEICWDLAGYTFAPVILPLQLHGRSYDSYSGGNYLQMLQASPHLGKLYMGYGCWWFPVAALCALAARFLTGVKGAFSKKAALPVLSGIWMCVCYTLWGAGQMDYKNTLFILCVWLIGMASAAVCGWETGGRPDEKGR